MEPKELLEEVRNAMEQYRLTLSPGIYLFAPEVMRGKMTGRIIEDRSDYPSNWICTGKYSVTFGFYPLGFVPKSMQGAPPSWISGYPLLQGLEKLTEAPMAFLDQLNRHLEERMQSKRQAGLIRPAAEAPSEDGIYSEESP